MGGWIGYHGVLGLDQDSRRQQARSFSGFESSAQSGCKLRATRGCAPLRAVLVAEESCLRVFGGIRDLVEYYILCMCGHIAIMFWIQ